MAHLEPEDLSDFFDLRKEFKRVVLQPSASEMRRRMEVRDPMAELAPDTNPDLHDCSEEDWARYRLEQVARLKQRTVECIGGSQVSSSVVGSNVEGMESCTTATLRTKADSVISDVDIWRQYSFDKQDQAWKVPIIDYKDKILECIGGNQIVVLSGPTGCGKSTQVPQYILNQHALERRNVNIVVTQPRKLAASSLAKRVCEERDWKLGGLVGYQVGLDKANKSEDTRLLYVTTGLLKRMIIGKKNLNDWTHIILDEVHERDEDMDLLLILCKKFLFTNSRDTKKLRNYFSKSPSIMNCPNPTPFLDVGHRKKNRNATTFYYKDLIRSYRLHNLSTPDFQLSHPALHPSCIHLAGTLIVNMDQMEGEEKVKKSGAVLVFLPGINEIQEVREYLMKMKEDKPRGRLDWWIIPLHSSIPWEDLQRVYEEAPPRTRKIILATNIAESSLTIPDIRYVIDFALTKNNQADEETNYPRLVLQWECYNQLVQRSGRAGRVNHDGRVYVLIPQSLAEELPKEHMPEIQRVPLTKVVLDVKMLDLGSPKEILALAMDPPRIQSLLRSIVQLQEMKALRLTVNGVQTRDDGDLTVLGEIIAKLPIDVKLGKLIFFGHIFGVLKEAIIIACGLNGKSIFTAPFDKKVQAYKNKLLWADRTFSDCHAILHAFLAWKNRKDRGDFLGRRGKKAEMEFCRIAFLQRNQLQEMQRLVDEIEKTLTHLQIKELNVQNPLSWDGLSKDVVLETVMFGAFYPNYFIKQAPADIASQANKILHGKDPRTTVYLTGMKEDQGKYGDIYSGQVKSIFKDCTKDEEKIHLTFKDSKIFVEFDLGGAQQDRWVQDSMDRSQMGDQEENMTGDILHQVYIASKLKNLGRNFHMKGLYVYSAEDARAIHQEWKAALTAHRGLNTNNIQQIQPPQMGEEKILIKNFSHISSPSVFWVRFGDGPDRLGRIQSITEQVLERCLAVSDDVTVGQVFLAPSSRLVVEGKYQNYSRVRVSSVRDHKVAAFFIDFGFTEFVAIRKLRMIPRDVIEDFSELVTIPGLAIECCLSGLQPNKARTVKGLWDEKVVDKFQQLTQAHVSGDIVGNIFSVTKSASGNGFVVNLASLEILTEENEIDIVKALLEEKLASVAVESLTSQEDHKNRLRFNDGTAGIQKYLDTNTGSFSAFNLKFKLSQEDSGRKKEWVGLSGPFTPLEHKVQALYRSGQNKGASLDQDSVNSVLLNRNPGDNHNNWLVAAHVGMTSSGESLGLRNSFWLSSKPGMGELLTMVFAPEVQLRIKEGDDLHRRKITGFIAGMGPKVHWNKAQVSKAEVTEAFYPEHDMEIRLNIHVDNEDIEKINQLRSCLNEMMTRSADGSLQMTQPRALLKTQRFIQSSLRDLLERQRMKEEETVLPYNLAHRWNIQDPNMIQRGRPMDLGPEFWIYKKIEGLRPEKSREEKKENQAQLDLVMQLWRQAEMFSEVPLPYHEVCPLCPSQVMLQTRRQIYLHLNTREHQIREKEALGDLDNASTIGASSNAPSKN